jgi:hypothetical protein
MTYSEIIIPDWCKYPEPTNGILGCWALIAGCIEGLCETCDEFKPGDYPISHIKAVEANQKEVSGYLKGLEG